VNRLLFGAKNFLDKLVKIIKDPVLFGYYVNSYVVSRFKKVEPDVYIVSYPKCGKTWIRVTLLKYLELSGGVEDSEIDGFQIRLPGDKTLKFEHDVGTWVPSPKSIDRLKINEAKYRGKKVCFVARDPRDVMVSSFYHLKFREKIYTKELTEFIRDKFVGIKKVVAFMNLWVGYRDTPDKFYFTTYEELRGNPEKGFYRLLDFIGIDVDPEVLKSTLKETSFEKMKKMESDKDLQEPWMKPGDKKSDKSMKIRKGKVGGYKDELSTEDISFLDDVIEKSLSRKLPYGGKRE